MTCIRFGSGSYRGIMCVSPTFRLRLADGRRVFMEWHNYLGPTFYRDRGNRRMLEDWYEDPQICAALAWFTARGNRA